MINDNIRISSNRSFGIVFFVVFLVVALYPLIKNGEIRLWSFVISLIFLVLGILNSKILFPLNKLWFKFGILLGKIITPIIMGLTFFVIVTPIGIAMRLLGKDVLSLKYNKNKTYWIEKKLYKSKMKNQF